MHRALFSAAEEGDSSEPLLIEFFSMATGAAEVLNREAKVVYSRVQAEGVAFQKSLVEFDGWLSRRDLGSTSPRICQAVLYEDVSAAKEQIHPRSSSQALSARSFEAAVHALTRLSAVVNPEIANVENPPPNEGEQQLDCRN